MCSASVALRENEDLLKLSNIWTPNVLKGGFWLLMLTSIMRQIMQASWLGFDSTWPSSLVLIHTLIVKSSLLLRSSGPQGSSVPWCQAGLDSGHLVSSGLCLTIWLHHLSGEMKVGARRLFPGFSEPFSCWGATLPVLKEVMGNQGTEWKELWKAW